MRFSRYWFGVFIYMGGIFYLSSLSIPHIPPVPHFTDKILHFIVYTAFTLIVSKALIESKIGDNWWIWAIVICCFYGLTDELHQSFVVGRDCSGWDWVADAVGGMSAILVLRYTHYGRRLLKRE